MKIGFHVSIEGKIYESVERAKQRGCNCMQIFQGSPRSWSKSTFPTSDIKEFNVRIRQEKIDPVFVHTIYLTNLAAQSSIIRKRSIESTVWALEFSDRIHSGGVVTHIGSNEDKKKGIKIIASSIESIFINNGFKSMLLLENSAGAGNTIGSKFSEIGEIIERLSTPSKVGMCLDTSHAFASGYDLTTTESIDKVIEELNRYIGIERLRLIHLNDSIGDLSSHIDRHYHIGKGKIGLGGFRNLLKNRYLNVLPLIMETPGKDIETDLSNMATVKKIIAEEGLN